MNELRLEGNKQWGIKPPKTTPTNDFLYDCPDLTPIEKLNGVRYPMTLPQGPTELMKNVLDGYMATNWREHRKVVTHIAQSHVFADPIPGTTYWLYTLVTQNMPEEEMELVERVEQKQWQMVQDHFAKQDRLTAA